MHNQRNDLFLRDRFWSWIFIMFVLILIPPHNISEPQSVDFVIGPWTCFIFMSALCVDLKESYFSLYFS